MAKHEVIGGKVTWRGQTIPLSWATRAGDFVFVSGMVAMGESGDPEFSGDAGEQTRSALEYMQSILAQADLTLADVVKVGVFLKDKVDFPAYNKVYGQFFPEAPPARFTVCSGFMADDCLVEMDAVAYAPQ